MTRALRVDQEDVSCSSSRINCRQEVKCNGLLTKYLENFFAQVQLIHLRQQLKGREP